MRAPILLFLIGQVFGSIYWDEYETCKNDADYGNTTLVCDPSHRLANSTTEKLTDMLRKLQSRIGCECVDGCRRADGRDNFIGLLHVTNTKNTDDLKADMEREYAAAKLGNVTCDHGLLLVYLKDSQKLATFRGGDSFVLLTDEDMQKLHELAAKGTEGDADNTLALQFLLSNYKDVVSNPVQRAESWLPIIGLIAAVLIVLCITGVLLSMFLARFCCCCAKRNKDVYHVNTLPSYKTVEPLYVITPPGHPGRSPLGDQIYSTPYSGSPLPYPPPPGASVPVTPSSTFRHAVNHETPTFKKPRMVRDSDPGSIPRAPGSEYSAPGGVYAPSELTPPMILPPTELYGTIPRATLIPRNGQPPSPQDPKDLPFLDPNRKQETQTREELIY
ncbi:hypothetical protein V3C99_005455 [Haemonchus contortus]